MRTEKILALVVLVGLLFKYLHWPFSGFILVLSLSGLAMIYFAGGVYFFSDGIFKKQNKALSVISGFFLALVPLGILYKIQYWPMSGFFLFIGGMAALGLTIISYFLHANAKEDLKTYYKNMLLRTCVLTLLSILFYLTPSATLLSIQYRDDPEMARLKSLYFNNRENKEYKRQLDAYVHKQDSLILFKAAQEPLDTARQ